MGLFSWQCKRCDSSIISPYAMSEVNKWENDAVVILENGTLIIGEYDGYGRMEVAQDVIEFYNGSEKLTMYHKACWDVLGQPSAYAGESPYADDQGHFFDESTHNSPPPKYHVFEDNVGALSPNVADEDSAEALGFIHVDEEALIGKIMDILVHDLDADAVAKVAETIVGGDINFIDCAYRVYPNENYNGAFGQIGDQK